MSRVVFLSAAYGPVFYTRRRSCAMSGQHLGDAGNGGDGSPVDGKSSSSLIAKQQHSYEHIDHAHFLANDINTLYLNDRSVPNTKLDMYKYPLSV